MPKVIHNVEKIIYKKAEYLFSHKGYDNVDMKAIAKECEIAVGTLYNYYGNKKDLFLKVFASSWENTFNKLNKALKGDDVNRNIISILYFDIKERAGLGANIFNSKSFSSEENDKINTKIIEGIVNTLSFNKEEMSVQIEKIIKIIIYNIVLLSNEYPENDIENIDILINILNSNLK